MRAKSGRSSLVVWSFPSRQTRGCTHVFTHGQANSRLGEAAAALFPAPSWDEGAGSLWRWHIICGAGCPAPLLPGRTWPAMPGRRRAALTPADCPAQEHAFLTSRKAAAEPLTPAGHVAGQKNWERAQENGTIPDWPFFHCTTGTQCWTDRHTMALALSCIKKDGLCGGGGRWQPVPVCRLRRIWWTVQFYSVENKAAAVYLANR